MHDAKARKEPLKSVKDRIIGIFADKGYESKSVYNPFGERAVIPRGRTHAPEARDHLQERE